MTADAIKMINDLERDLGKTLLAFQCHNLKPSELNGNELQKIVEIESKWAYPSLPLIPDLDPKTLTIQQDCTMPARFGRKL